MIWIGGVIYLLFGVFFCAYTEKYYRMRPELSQKMGMYIWVLCVACILIWPLMVAGALGQLAAEHLDKK